ncbi:MAG: alpha/beta fold hydrolase [Solirubrobacteraceae bacterium]
MPGASHPILLLHGQPGTPRDWDAVVAEIGPRADTLAIRRPGWGPDSSPTGLEGNARAAIRALDHAGLKQAVVVGHSLGGAVAAWVAATHPDRVAALILLAPAANQQSLTALDRLLAAPVLGDLLSGASLAAAGGVLAARPVRQALAARLGVAPEYLRAWSGRLASPRAWRSFAAEQRMLVRELPVLETRLAEIGVPTTIVAGTADRIVPIASARSLASQIPHAELVELQGGHHVFHQQRPAEVAEIILDAAGP